jgi:lysophospholipase
MNILILLCSLVSTLLFAIPEKNFEENWKTKVYPFFENLQQGELKNAQGMTIKYFSYTRTSHERSLVIVPGRTEPSRKYAELIYDLRDKGLDIYILDHQGQGESERLLSDTNKGHVRYFHDYVRDLDQFISEVVMRPGKETYLMAFSMGGGITSHYLARYPQLIKKALFVSPMLEINTKPYSEKVALYYSRLLMSIGKGEEYAPDRGPYKPEEVTFENNDATQSEARFFVEKFLFTTYPYLAVGGPTSRWVHESLKATAKTTSLRISTQILLLQAGKDNLVKPGRQNEFCKPAFCRMKKYQEAKHEILMEKDSIRDDALKEIGLFFGF